jgi:tripartite-type tricarboxylate transporter receptor subunit TctC
MKRRTLLALSILSLSVTAALTSTPVVAQQYPDKPVKIIVSFAPGGATDVVARKLAQKFQEIYKQPFIVENRPRALAAHSARHLLLELNRMDTPYFSVKYLHMV